LVGWLISDILDPDHLPIFFLILDHDSAKDISASVETHTNCEQLRSLASDIISLRIHAENIEETDRVANNVIASIASAYRLPTRKLTISESNSELLGLQHLLQHK